MKLAKALSIAALSIALVACSSSPSEKDVQAVATQQLQQLDQQFGPLGLKFSDVFEVKVKIVNKAKQADGSWLIESDLSFIAKKDTKDLSEDAQFAIISLYGGHLKKGEIVGGASTREQLHMKKGNNGWMAMR